MKKITTIIFILICQTAFTQAITYGYDNAGNQTSRVAYSSSSTEVTGNEELAMEQLLALVEQTATSESTVPNQNDEENESATVNRLSNSLKITVYPNPATDVVYLNKESFGTQKEAVATVYLINSQGKILERIKTADTRTAIDVRHLSDGVYYVRYVGDGNSLAWSVVKK